MQNQKYQFSRKHRKLLSRDRSGHHRASGKSIPKEGQQKRIPTSSEHITFKHRYPIAARKNDHGFKQQGSKLLKKDNKKTSNKDDIRMEYEGYSPRQKNSINLRLFINSQSQRSLKSNDLSLARSNQQTLIEGSDRMPTFEHPMLVQQLKQYQKQNRELNLRNQALSVKVAQVGQQFRREYQTRLRQLQMQRGIVRVDESEQNDRTVIVQQENKDQKRMIAQLKELVKNLNGKNSELKKEIDHLMTNINKKGKEQVVIKDQEISKLMREVDRLQNIDKLRFKEIVKLKKDLKKQERQNQKLKNVHSKCQDTIVALNKKMSAFKELEQLKWDERSKKKIRQLQQIIVFHEKSLQNYESDMHYLQGRVQQLTPFPKLNQNISSLLQQMNSNCLKLNARLLNAKYNSN